ncbi:MAG: AbrB/MazE/SpoVT family DNA-binding domain-containing protein [Candidatus Bathyarchaeia archaeon]
MEIQIGSKGRITLPIKMRMLLGIKEGDSLKIEITNKGILLKPKGPSAEELWGAAKIEKIEIEEIEEALGKES